MYFYILNHKKNTMLKEGDKAPYFKGIDQHGNKVSLTDYKGKKGVLRTTFILNEEGRIEKVFTKVNAQNHARQIILAFENHVQMNTHFIVL
jgi:peroxiredoxin